MNPENGRSSRGCRHLAALAALFAGGFARAETAAQGVTVTIDRTMPIATSQFCPGISQIDNSLDFPRTGNDAAAVANARALVASGLYWVNNPIMAWGVRNPWPDPAQAGPTEWSQLDGHLLRIVDWGATPIVTLCEAPWWMKGRRQADGTTSLIPSVSGEWRSFTYADGFTDHRGIFHPAGNVSPDPYGCRILDNQMDRWLTLVEAVARRYMVAPYHVRHFQVWNELKGYHNPAANRWDYSTSPGDPTGWNAQHGYTYMYNQVYERLVATAASLNINPAEIHIGGPYVVMASGVSRTKMSHPSDVRGPWGGQSPSAARPPLWTPTSLDGGGMPLPWYYSYRNLGLYFGPGTRLYAARSSSPDVAALASATHTLLVNKTGAPVMVTLDGTTVVMSAYDVVLLDIRSAVPRQAPSQF